MNTFTLARSSLRAAARQQQQCRGLAMSAVRTSAGAHMVDPENAAKDLEDGKRKSVKGVKDNTVENAPEWNEKVASVSEAIIKGSKDNRDPQELARETVEKLAKQDLAEKKSS